ncbi:MAG: NAD-dependent epimerase/dehydratase family protein [Gammaproteobacteria bacterium]|nr:NAD-dependent epimerase/dehydratase family protein [Gammaproteobacteria bacterium]
MLNNIKIIGCGYIGKKIASFLKAEGIGFHCYVKSEVSKETCLAMGYQVTQFNLDIVGLGLNNNLLNEFNKSTIAYLAPPQRSGLTDERMENFITSLEMAQTVPDKVILISTSGVYGNCNGDWIDESRVAKPQAERAFRRLSAETQLIKYCEKNNVQFIVFRVPGIYASDKLPVKRITSGEPIVNAADSGYTNRIHAEDLAAICSEALLENVKPGIYNCCDGQPSTMNDYFIKVADALNYPRPEEISLSQARRQLSEGMLSYLAESKRMSNKKLLKNFKTKFKYPDLTSGLKSL